MLDSSTEFDCNVAIYNNIYKRTLQKKEYKRVISQILQRKLQQVIHMMDQRINSVYSVCTSAEVKPWNSYWALALTT